MTKSRPVIGSAAADGARVTTVCCATAAAARPRWADSIDASNSDDPRTTAPGMRLISDDYKLEVAARVYPLPHGAACFLRVARHPSETSPACPRDRAHSSVGGNRPQIARRGIDRPRSDCERRPADQRRYVAECKVGQWRTRVRARQPYQPRRLEWALHDDARVSLDVRRVVTVVVNAMAIEGECRIAEQKRRCGHGHLDAITRTVRIDRVTQRNGAVWREEIRNVLSLVDRHPAARLVLVPYDNEEEWTTASLRHAHV